MREDDNFPNERTKYAPICIMRITPRFVWDLVGESVEPIDGRLLPLLEAVATSASLAAAVAECGVSYRAAWGLLRDYEHKFGAALVVLERGRGASLTAAGKSLVDAQHNAARRLAGLLPGLAADIGSQRGNVRSTALELRLAASHDLALAALREASPSETGLRLEVSFTGSLQAIQEFSAARADIAGFHVPIAGCESLKLKPYLKWLRARRDRLIRFADRDQGLILARGNPKKVRKFRDIATKKLRFVNRQRGSGTRLLVDQMMADDGIDPTAIDGYRTEEFTHAAVAATVASGGADAGFGLRAAAAEYHLAFVPLIRERYFFAVRAKHLESSAVARLIEVLKGPVLARTVRHLAGYDTSAAGSVIALDALGARVEP
jgi:molybdate transport repressor ModE-like protein